MTHVLPLDTLKTRTDIGFHGRDAWVQAPAVYDGTTLKINGHPVMEDWEHPYMKSLADAASAKGGETLEVGYGMGISASYMLGNPKVQSHSVIECHPDVVKKAMDDQRCEIKANRFHIHSGFWQDVVPHLASGSYQGILFDSYPLTKEEIHKNHFTFFKDAYRLLKPGGTLAYYSDEEVGLSPDHLKQLTDAGFRAEDIDYGICEIDTPKDCKYWQAKTFLVPVIRKPEASVAMARTPRGNTPLMRVAIDKEYELTEIRPDDKKSVATLPSEELRQQAYRTLAGTQEAEPKDLLLALRKRGSDKSLLGLVGISGIDGQGEAKLNYQLVKGQKDEIIVPALASTIKYAMQHFKVKSLHAGSGLSAEQKPKLEKFGFTGQPMYVGEIQIRQKLGELGLPKNYCAEEKVTLAPAKPDPQLRIFGNRHGFAQVSLG